MKNHWLERKEKREEEDMAYFRKRLTEKLNFPDDFWEKVIKFDEEGNPTNLLDIVNEADPDWDYWVGDVWSRSTVGYLPEEHAILEYSHDRKNKENVLRRLWGNMCVTHADYGDHGNVMYHARGDSQWEEERVPDNTKRQKVLSDESAKNAREAKKKKDGGMESPKEV